MIALLLAQLVMPSPSAEPLSPPGMVCMGECSDGPMVWRASPARGRLVVACDMTSDTCSDGRKITTVRATPVPCETSPGVWEMVGVDEGCYGVRGLESWAATTSYLSWGADLDRSPWGSVRGGTLERVADGWRVSNDPTQSNSGWTYTGDSADEGATYTVACRVRADEPTPLRITPLSSGGSACPIHDVGTEWQTVSCTREAGAEMQTRAHIWPGVGQEGPASVIVAGCWLAKATTPGRACWGGEAPVTCADDQHTISTEGWPTTHGSIEIEFRIDEAPQQFAIILDSRSSAAMGFNIHYERATGRLNHRQGDRIMVGPTITLGTWYRVRLEREGGDVRMYVNGVLGAAESDWPAWSYLHQSGGALLGKHAFVTDFYLNGPIRALRIRSYEEVSP